MSHSRPHDEEFPLLKPKPSRPFELTTPSGSTGPSSPTTPVAPTTPSSDSLNSSAMEGSSTPSRTRSILNLTSSTLFGIYQPTGYDTNRDEPATPWGTGAQTPSERSRHASFDLTSLKLNAIPDTVSQRGTDGKLKRRRRSTAVQPHHKPRKGFRRYFLPLVGRILALFGVGVLYGLLIGHLHDRQNLAPVKLDIDRSSWVYLAVWGAGGVLLGEALPSIDKIWAGDDEDAIEDTDERPQKSGARGVGHWNDVVRSVAAFVGVAFAIRKLAWQSTLQLSLTLALSNPAVWYLVDRSVPGFILSSMVSLTGTVIVLGFCPTWVPHPPKMGHVVQRAGDINGTLHGLADEDLVLGMFTQESVGVATWVASVLFVSSVCFGNIGRRLAPRTA